MAPLAKQDSSEFGRLRFIGGNSIAVRRGDSGFVELHFARGIMSAKVTLRPEHAEQVAQWILEAAGDVK